MNELMKSRAALIATALVIGVGGVAYEFEMWAPTPKTQTMAAMRDAGYGDGQGVVRICPERLTANAKRRIQREQPGFLRPKQAYAVVARAGDCYDRGGQLLPCFNAARLAVRSAQVMLPSLRFDVDGGELDLDGGEDDADQSTVPRLEDCTFVRCSQFDAGDVTVPYANGTVCGGNRMMALKSQCVTPNCWTGPGGEWDPTAVVDCKRNDPFTGAPTWMGCAPMPPEVSSGSACLPSACVLEVDDPPDWR